MDLNDIENRISDLNLAINGGKKIRAKPMPSRKAFGEAEYAMLQEAIRFYQDQGADPGYQGPFEQNTVKTLLTPWVAVMPMPSQPGVVLFFWL
jgi:hypothetical protein